METNGLTRLSAPIPEETFLRSDMYVGLSRDIFITW